MTHSAAVVDEACQVATLGGIYNGVVVHSEQVAAPDALLCIPLLAIVSHHLVKRDRNFWSPRQLQLISLIHIVRALQLGRY